MDYITRIRNLREDSDKTQEQIATYLGTSQTMYARYERGANEMPIRHLIKLAKYYHVSLDYLLDVEVEKQTSTTSKAILIASPYENVLARCVSIVSSKKMSGGKLAPAYALFGVYEGKDSTIFLGWYANKEKITQEIMNIHNAILQGCGEYTLQYSVKTTRKWLKVQMVDEV